MQISEKTISRINLLKDSFPFEMKQMGICDINLNRDILGLVNTIQNIFPNAEVHFGASKVAIIFDDDDFVIKMPFYGYYVPAEDMDCYDIGTSEEPVIYRDFCLIPFSSARNMENCWNYCESEIECYTAHENDGYSFFFADIEYCGDTKGNIPVYIQEKVMSVYDMENADILPVSSFHSMRRVERNHLQFSNPCAEDDPDQEVSWANWLAVSMDMYSEDVVSAFVEYITNQDFMNDMHRKNYGFRKNGTPCILDYSGYYEEY